MTTLFYLALAIMLFSVSALLVNLLLAAPERTAARRIAEVTQHEVVRGPSPTKVLGKSMLHAMKGLRVTLGMVENQKLRDRFMAAGMRKPEHMELYLGARLLAPLLGVLIGTFFPSNTFLWAVALAGAGYLGPDFWLERKVKGRRHRISRSMPDAIDLLVICVDAGLGLDQAMLRVGQELAVSHPEINEEFLQINREQRAGRPRVDAWKGFAERTRLPEIQNFVSMLVQTERFGTPITRALNTFSDSMRLKRKQIAEEKAAKTTVKMLFPLVLFIFPCIFIVLLGPAFITISKGLFHMTQ
ncbi:type II secretion system F family protein [Acidobacterium capsulatum]|uniref:Type II secretion system protein n=1 Tax=Acidobacterium capsulatum (strain ATCC 51196 / DSM 11244 / BCRC 80197 / JCM 7670 / NBRC 15755 / NCIMB 13165 / 161) TaxID=240015 RepID=C1F482_ACIC5|nr:type II secretion system F family protein [Acidobacterium capsulatum]ACO33480.1 type II secretion system protein [Acidobacterium capsulatum ATCC 51196]HCT60338.1 type II secretion system F family protein [Acidobacterium sp.]